MSDRMNGVQMILSFDVCCLSRTGSLGGFKDQQFVVLMRHESLARPRLILMRCTIQSKLINAAIKHIVYKVETFQKGWNPGMWITQTTFAKEARVCIQCGNPTFLCQNVQILPCFSNPLLCHSALSAVDSQICKPFCSLPATKQQSPLPLLTLYFVLTSPGIPPFCSQLPAVPRPILSNSWLF